MSPAPVPKDIKRQQNRPARPRRGLSLDRIMPNTTRPPLPHAVTMEAPRRPRRDRPPLRRSIRLEDDDAAAEERRRVFGHGPRAPSFDEGDASDEHEECDCRRSLERSGPSADTPDDDEIEPEFAISPPDVPVERNTHVRGASADRILDRRDGPPTLRAHSRAQSQGVFERRLPRIYKLGLIDKSKRASSSALYERTDRSPTEAFYNATGSTRLSSQELFEKFCSEDFTSLYGHEELRRRDRRPPHSKSTGSSGSDVRHERGCKRIPCASQPALTRRHVCHVTRSDRSTDSEETSPRRSQLRQLPHETERQNSDDCSRSAPLLSPDRFEARFTFDISERSEVTSNRDETPSDVTETRNLTLYEEPHSDRTSICELYDAAFSSQRPSLRRDSSKKRFGPFDLSALDFRPIDDESPRTSRRTSQKSIDDTIRQNSESRSWASDSVFNTPERRQQDTSPSSTDTRRYLTAQCESVRADSAAADSTLAETTTVEEVPSVIERSEYSLALQLEPTNFEDDDDEEEKVPTPTTDARLSSRPSMHKLEPFEPERLCGGGNEEDVSGSRGADTGTAALRRRRGASEPRRAARCFPL